jgi:hypothetical protein
MRVDALAGGLGVAPKRRNRAACTGSATGISSSSAQEGGTIERSAEQGGLIRLLAIVEPIELATDAGLMTPQ